MGKENKKNKTDKPKKEEKILKTSDYTDFISEIKEMNSNISKDIEENRAEEVKKGFYLGFNQRLLLSIVLLIITIVELVYCVAMGFAITKSELIKYKINSDIDYKVYLRPNEFYETDYLEKDMVYVASLIDKIKVKYDYKFNVNRNSNIDFDYKIIGRLVIASTNNQSVFYEKQYDLTDEFNDSIKAKTDYSINKEVSIDYPYYNSLANKFRSNYAVNTNSYLEVYLLVNEKNAKDNYYELNNKSKAILTIPLSQQEINITLNNQNIDENKQLVSNSKFIVKNTGYLVISIILMIFMIVLMIYIIKKIVLLTNNKSKYDIYIEKILRGYDRIIVNIKTIPNFENYNIIKVESFQEIIDVRDNFKCPINYYVITPHQKCEFFVINNNDLYIYVVKAIDLDGENKNEEK